MFADDLIEDHPYKGYLGGSCQFTHAFAGSDALCGQQAMMHVDAGPNDGHLINAFPHEYLSSPEYPYCGYRISLGYNARICGYPEEEHLRRRPVVSNEMVRAADVAQYAREPMPAAARAGIRVSLVDAPTDPLGTLAAIAGIYEGKVRRSKAEVTDDDRRAAYDAMMATVLSGPLEAIQFTFFIEGIDRAITHQLVRNRFSFFAQESLRFAVADNWAEEVPLPPALLGRRGDDPAVVVWRAGLEEAERRYAMLIAAGMPAEEARGLLPHAITTRIFWTVSLRTLLMEAGKRTCTQAQFPWRTLFAGVAKALRERSSDNLRYATSGGRVSADGWQYELFADAIRPVCYQQGKCGFMAKFDRGCTIRGRVDAFSAAGVPSNEWDMDHLVKGSGREVLHAILPREWAADPSAARVTEGTGAAE